MYMYIVIKIKLLYMYIVIKIKLLYMYIVIKIKLLRVKGQHSPNGGQAMAWLAWPVAMGLFSRVTLLVCVLSLCLTNIEKMQLMMVHVTNLHACQVTLGLKKPESSLKKVTRRKLCMPTFTFVGEHLC